MTQTKEKPKKSKPSAIAKKSAARLVAVQLVYEQLMRPCDTKTLLLDYKNNRIKLPIDEGDELVAADLSLLSRIVNGIDEKRDIFDEMIAGKRPQKDKKLEALLHAILLCGVYELFANNDVDTGIIISDYLHVTEAFFDGSETKIVNAILDNIAKDIRG